METLTCLDIYGDMYDPYDVIDPLDYIMIEEPNETTTEFDDLEFDDPFN